MSLKIRLQEDQRLVILRSLLDMNGYQANESILQMSLDMYGHNISRELVLTHMRYLEELMLIELEDVNGVQVATLLSRGQDVATGRATVPGVNRPRAR